MANSARSIFGVGVMLGGEDSLTPMMMGASRSVAGFDMSLGAATIAAGALSKEIGAFLSGAGQKFLNFLSRGIEEAIGLESKLMFVSAISGKGTKEVSELTDEFIRMSSSLPLSAHELAEVGIVASQMGVYANNGKQAVLDLSLAASQLAAVSRDLNEAEAAEAVGALLAIFGLEGKDFAQNANRMSAVLTDLAFSSKATQGELAEIAKRAGGVGDMLKMTAPQILAFASVAKDIKLQTEIAGTGISRLLGDMAAKADRFAAILGMNTDEWMKIVSDRPTEALFMFLRKLNEAGAGAAGILKKVALSRATYMPLIFTLAKNMDKLTDRMAQADRAWEKGTRHQEAFNEMTKSLEKQVDTLAGSIQNLFIEVGRLLLPIAKVATAIGIKFVAALNDLHPLVKSVLITIIGVIGSVLVLGGALFALSGGILLAKGLFITLAASAGYAVTANMGLVASIMAIMKAQLAAAGAMAGSFLIAMGNYIKSVYMAIMATQAHNLALLAQAARMKFLSQVGFIYANVWHGQVAVAFANAFKTMWAWGVASVKWTVLSTLGMIKYAFAVASTNTLMGTLLVLTQAAYAKMVMAWGAISGVLGFFMSPALIAALPFVLGGIAAIAAGVMILYAGFQFVRAELDVLWGSMQYFFQAIQGVLSVVWGVIKEIMKSVVALFLPVFFLGKLLLLIISHIMSFFGSVFRVVGGLLQIIAVPIKIILRLFQAIMYALGYMVGFSAAPLILTVLKKITEPLRWMVDLIGQVISEFSRLLSAAWAQEMAQVFSEIGDAWNELISAVYEFLTAIMSVFGSSDEAAKESVSTLELVMGVLRPLLTLMVWGIKGVAAVLWAFTRPFVWIANLIRWIKGLLFGSSMWHIKEGVQEVSPWLSKLITLFYYLMKPLIMLKDAFVAIGGFIYDYFIGPLVSGIGYVMGLIGDAMEALGLFESKADATDMGDAMIGAAVGGIHANASSISPMTGKARDENKDVEILSPVVIPFAKGGVVTDPTLGLVGEAGDEAIIPLDKIAGIMLPIMSDVVKEIPPAKMHVNVISNEQPQAYIGKMVAATGDNLVKEVGRLTAEVKRLSANNPQNNVAPVNVDMTIPVSVELDGDCIGKAVAKVQKDDVLKNFGKPNFRGTGVT